MTVYESLNGEPFSSWEDVFEVAQEMPYYTNWEYHWFEFAIKINVSQQLKESVGSVRHITIDEMDSDGLLILV